MKKKLALVRNRTMSGLGAVVGVSALMVASASAQTANPGVTAIVDAIDGLKPDMGTIVVSGIGLGLIGFIGLAGWALVKRFGR